MTKQNHLRFRRGDVLAIVLVAVLAVCVAACFFPKDSSGPVMAEVYQAGKLVKTLPLDSDTSFQVAGRYVNNITVENGKIGITASDCPGEDCVHSGAINSSGRSIVCLPNEVEVRVINAQSDVDFVVG